jgi:hypothetical protein
MILLLYSGLLSEWAVVFNHQSNCDYSEIPNLRSSLAHIVVFIRMSSQAYGVASTLAADMWRSEVVERTLPTVGSGKRGLFISTAQRKIHASRPWLV